VKKAIGETSYESKKDTKRSLASVPIARNAKLSSFILILAFSVIISAVLGDQWLDRLYFGSMIGYAIIVAPVSVWLFIRTKNVRHFLQRWFVSVVGKEAILSFACLSSALISLLLLGFSSILIYGENFLEKPLLFSHYLWFLAPTAEEVLFRGYVFETLRHRYPQDVAVIALGTVIFAAFHFFSPSSILFAVGANILRYYSDSLIPCIVAHFIWNFGLTWIRSFAIPKEPFLGTTALIIACVICGAVFLMGMIGLFQGFVKFRRKNILMEKREI
jgi:membrane protease YdiL (CAAX protease family)